MKTDNYSGFDDSAHMFSWTDAEIGEVIRFYIEDAVSSAHPESSVSRIVCSEEPKFLTGAKKQDDDPDKVILTRMAVLFQTELTITTEGEDDESVSGVSLLVCQNLDEPEEQRMRLMFTPDGNLDEMEDSMAVEIYRDEFDPRG